MKREIDTAAEIEPVTLAELREHSRITWHNEDKLMLRYLREGREAAEEFLWQRLITQTWDQYFDRFAARLPLELSPVQSIESVKYVDSDGVLQTLASSVYELGDDNGLGFVRLAYNQIWPVARSHADAVVVRHTVGYGDAADDVPEQIKAAICIYAVHRHQFRGGEPVPEAFYNLLRPLSARRF